MKESGSGMGVYASAVKRAVLGALSFAFAFALIYLLVAFAVSFFRQDGRFADFPAADVPLLLVLSALCRFGYKVELDKSLCLSKCSKFVDRDGTFPYVRHGVRKREAAVNDPDYPKIIAAMLYFSEGDKSGDRRDLALSTLFLTALVSPQSVFASITDNITPRSRSLFVESEIDIRIPYNLRMSSFVVPILMHERDGLPDDLHVEALSDTIVSTLNLQETIDYLMKVAEVCFPYLADDAELRAGFLRFISDANDYSSESVDDDGNADTSGFARRASKASRYEVGNQRASDMEGLYQKYCAKLKETGMGQEKALRIERLFLGVLDTLLFAYPICARVCSKAGTMEKDATVFDGLCFDSSVERKAQIVVRRSYPLIKVEPAFTGCAALDRMLNCLCHRPMTLYYDLGDADRTQSYHFRTKGPEGTYFRFAGMKRLPDRKENVLEADMAFLQRRHGQRHARFAVKDGFGFSGWSFMFRYDERSFTIFHMLLVVSLIPVLLFWLIFPEVVAPSSDQNGMFSVVVTIAGALTVVASLAGAWVIDRRGAGQVYPVRPWLILFAIGAATITVFGCIVLTRGDGGGAQAYSIVPPYALLCTLSLASFAIIRLNYHVHTVLSGRSADAIQRSLIARGEEPDISCDSSKPFETWSPGWHASSYHRIPAPVKVKVDSDMDIEKHRRERRDLFKANANYVRDTVLYGRILCKSDSLNGGYTARRRSGIYRHADARKRIDPERALEVLGQALTVRRAKSNM